MAAFGPVRPPGANMIHANHNINQTQYGIHDADAKVGKAPEADKIENVQHQHHYVEDPGQGWFLAECFRVEQERLARVHLQAICSLVDERHAMGMCPDGRWINDPEEFPTPMINGQVIDVMPFPPHDQQYYVCGMYQPEKSKLTALSLPTHGMDEDGNSAWMRLVDFAPHQDASHLFDEFTGKTHFGRVYQGSLDTGYLTEALQAISMRPKLVRQLFYCWDQRRSVYVARLYKHGCWLRVELDDYVPVGPPGADVSSNVPICARSEFFPSVLWPSLAEKAYAKVHTWRGSTTESTPEDAGGWESIGGGGMTEEALADFTGGVAGRFRTSDVSPDRLFLYIHELQRDTLFVCRPSPNSCDMYAVHLNPYYPNVVNRAVVFEGRCYIQVFCGAPGVYDGGLSETSVPWGLINSKEYPERTGDGFWWCTAEDFHYFFDTIIECRLVNSGDVSIPGMPPPRMQGFLGGGMLGIPGAMPPMMPGMPPPMGFAPMGGPILPGMLPPGAMPGLMEARLAPDGSPLMWYEWVHACGDEVTRHNEPEFTIRVPDDLCPVEIVASVEQGDPRMAMKSPVRQAPEAILAKVYESAGAPNCYSSVIVCKSNWVRTRDSMLSFCCRRGGEYKVVAEFPNKRSQVSRMIFRCYASKPGVVVSAGVASRKHLLVEAMAPPKAYRFTLSGCMTTEQMQRRGLKLDEPEPFDYTRDHLRKAEDDVNTGWYDLQKEVRQDCSIM